MDPTPENTSELCRITKNKKNKESEKADSLLIPAIRDASAGIRHDWFPSICLRLIHDAAER